jgi:hypothetical protein
MPPGFPAPASEAGRRKKTLTVGRATSFEAPVEHQWTPDSGKSAGWCSSVASWRSRAELADGVLLAGW